MCVVKTPSYLKNRRGLDSNTEAGYSHPDRTCINYLTILSLTGTPFVSFPFLPISGEGGRWKNGSVGRDVYSHADGENGWMEGNDLVGWKCPTKGCRASLRHADKSW